MFSLLSAHTDKISESLEKLHYMWKVKNSAIYNYYKNYYSKWTKHAGHKSECV